MIREEFLAAGEYAAAGLYEEPSRGLFYRKALGIRRYYENCELAQYRGEYLYPSGVVRQKMSVVPEYMNGLNFDALRGTMPHLWDEVRSEFRLYRSSVPAEHTIAGNMYTHAMPNYMRILKEGLYSYRARIEKIEDDDLRDGLIHVWEGICTYIRRCLDYLTEVHADEKLIAALRKVPLYPAENIYEAIVCWNFILYLDNCDNLGALEVGLAPYYHGEDVEKYLENLYDNIDKNDGYSVALQCDVPSLTVQCLRAAACKRRPMIELFVDEKTPDCVWEAAFDVVKTGGGQPAFYNPHILLDGLRKRFPNISERDIRYYCGGGCTESMITGYSNVGSLDAGVNLLWILERYLYAHLAEAKTFDAFLEGYLAEVASETERVKTEINNSRANRARLNPLPMRTFLIDDCIDRGCEYNSGGARYNWSIISFAALTNVIDSLLNVKTWIFDEKTYTKDEMIALLKSNDASLRMRAISMPTAHGKDIEEVNRFSAELSRRIFSLTETGELLFGEGFISASILFRAQVQGGCCVGATPDGRVAGEPISDSLGAIFGKDSNGPTALLNSVSSLCLDKALGVPVLNFNITKNFTNTVLRALVLGYMKQGGVQLQMTCASKEELMDAYEHPELHANLIVRVGGYSEYFNRLEDGMKKMIIRRTIQAEER